MAAFSPVTGINPVWVLAALHTFEEINTVFRCPHNLNLINLDAVLYYNVTLQQLCMGLIFFIDLC